LQQAGTSISNLLSGAGGSSVNPLDSSFSNTVTLPNTDNLPSVLPSDISSAPGYDWNAINTGTSDLSSAASGVNLGGLFGL
jgi:hypothetical protein